MLGNFSKFWAKLSLAASLWAFVATAQDTKTSAVDVARAAATARTNSPTSSVKGLAFDRIAIIWLENTDYAKAVGDRMYKVCPTGKPSSLTGKRYSQSSVARQKGDYPLKLFVFALLSLCQAMIDSYKARLHTPVSRIMCQRSEESISAWTMTTSTKFPRTSRPSSTSWKTRESVGGITRKTCRTRALRELPG